MNFKKILSIVLMFTMLAAILPASLVSAEDSTYTWEIDEEGVLTISGTGTIDFGQAYYQPWKNDINSIKSIVVNEGITSFGRGTFEGLKYVTSISLPKSLKSIGITAFSGCAHLQSVTFPESIEVIGQSAFSNCTSLTEITIPANITSIGGNAFSGCTSLKKAVFLNSLSNLPDSVFSGCTSLEDVTLPVGLASTAGSCFRNCTSLKKIVLPDTVTVLGSDTFYGCTSLQEVNTENILEYNGNRHFENCSSLDTITINETVKTIPAVMFGNSGITHLELPENLQTIDGNAFSGCTKLERVDIPEKLTNLRGGVFNGCVSLKEFSMPKNITRIDDSFFKDCTSLSKVTLHDNVTWISSNAFANCTSLKNITLPNNLEYLGYQAFNGTGITEITIPKSLITAGHGEGLSNGLSPYDYNKGPFGGSPLETAYFEKGTTEIPDGLFQGAQKLKNVDLSNIERIGAYAFSNCSEFIPVLTETTKEIGNYAFTRCSAITEFVLPEWMEKIPNGMLMGTGIGTLVFPDTVKEIGTDAYNGCKNLSYIEFSDTITDIGNSAFYGCTALDEIDIPGTVLNIGQSAFEKCSNLKKLTMHKGTQTMGGGAFADCALTDIRPSQTIRNLSDSMFNGNPVQILVVPRFCVEWSGWGNFFNNFNPSFSFVPANVQLFDIYTYDKATIIGVEGTAGYNESVAEVNSGNAVAFWSLKNGIEQLYFDKKNVDISLDETYDSASILTIDSEDVIIEDPEDAVIKDIIWEDRFYNIAPIETDSELITFSSDNEEVATVDETGYIHGVGYGTANITVSCDSGITDVLTVNVVRPSIGISISSGYEKLSVGNTVTLTANTVPAGYEENYVWSSSDEEIATVSDGFVTAVNAGSAVISVKGEYSGKTAKCVVMVTDGTELPNKIEIGKFILGCEILLEETESGGNVITALYDTNNKLIDAKTYAAAENIKAEFSVSATDNLSGAKIKVFWWNTELLKPVSNFRLIDIE